MFSLSCKYILSRASNAGSPTNHPGSDKTRDQGCFGPSTGGPDLKETNRTFDSPFLLRQGEPGTSQYITKNLVFKVVLVSLMYSCFLYNPSEIPDCSWNYFYFSLSIIINLNLSANTGAAAGGILFFCAYTPYYFIQPRYYQLSELSDYLYSHTTISWMNCQIIN